MDGGETDNRPSGEQAEASAPPGWYADPYGAPAMRRWDGEHWTLEDTPLPTPEVEAATPGEAAESSPAPFNWPALAATLVLAAFVAFMFQPNCSWEDDGAFVYGACLARDFPAAHNALDVAPVLGPLGRLLVVFGLLGVQSQTGEHPVSPEGRLRRAECRSRRLHRPGRQHPRTPHQLTGSKRVDPQDLDSMTEGMTFAPFG